MDNRLTTSQHISEAPNLGGKWRQLTVLAIAELFAMTLWFSASAVVPQLRAEWSLSDSQQAWMTMSVQIGFVLGALISAVLNLADRFSSRKLFSLSAIIGSLLTVAIASVQASVFVVLLLRFLTGVTLAGVYPPGMKLVTTWCREDRGLGIGILVGALTIGSASPHLINGLALFGDGGLPQWRAVLLVTASLAFFAALIVLLFFRSGPYKTSAAPFNWRFATAALAHKPTRLANFGYLGHMWELYAMWTWVPVLLLASYKAASLDIQMARMAGFAVIAIGGIGCVLAGQLADRFGRTTITIASMAVSGGCALIAGLFFSNPIVLTIISLVWGFAVVADSAQFSAAVSELSDKRYIGSALTIQTSMGFLLTMLSIRLIPTLVDVIGWRWVFAFLAIGPLAGIWAMVCLRAHPESVKMASGRR